MNPHGGQNWADFLIVMGILGLCLLATWLESRDWFLRQDLWYVRLVDDARTRPLGTPVPEVDHVECANPDCDQMICACRTPAECTGCTTIGCEHPNVHGGLLCWDCRLECRDCADEAYTEHATSWAAGR